MEQALKGTVEIDETYVGGKPRPGDGKEHKRGRGTSKTPVVAVVEREGNSQSEPVEHVDTKTLKSIASGAVDPAAELITDVLSVAEAAGVMAAEPLTMQLRYLQTLSEIATEQNSTIVFPIPVELLNFLKKISS